MDVSNLLYALRHFFKRQACFMFDPLFILRYIVYEKSSYVLYFKICNSARKAVLKLLLIFNGRYLIYIIC